MDSKRTGTTPSHSKPSQQKSAGSHSKFTRPRSTRKPDANVTLLGVRGHNASVMGSSNFLNHTVRQNLDLTLSGAGFPNIKSNFNPLANDELSTDLAYNDYLAALMKQQLVKQFIEQHDLKLDDQILIQSEHLHKLQDTYKDICEKIKNLKEQSDIVELLQVLQHSISDIEELCSSCNSHIRLKDLNKILLKESNLVSVKNIKPISSQEEYDKLMSTLSNLKCVAAKIVNADKNFSEVNELASDIKTYSELNSKMFEITQNLSNMNRKAAALFLKQTSDFFAYQGGYF